ncbi:MAG: aminodeoxychorismate synthase component I [Endomicrobiaceae bacterium]
MIIKKIDLRIEFYKLLDFLKEHSCPFLLDSGNNYKKLGKFSFIGFDPLIIFQAKDRQVEIIEHGKLNKFYSQNSIDDFQKIINKYKKIYNARFPFSGGFAGFLSYDLCRSIEKIPSAALDDKNMPDICFGLYDGIFIYDHKERETYIAAHGIENSANHVIEKLEYIAGLANKRGSDDCFFENIPKKINFKSDLSKKEYLIKVDKLKSYIKNGDIFQTNLTRRFEAESFEDSWMLYQKLRSINPAPFSAYFDYKDFQIISSSPERFIKVKKNRIETRPVKGTVARGSNKRDDVRNKQKLLDSEKDKSELVMIVDVSRNDLGRISEIGTVKVKQLFALEKYPTVYHLVSTVTGKLRQNIEFSDIIRATFPGASITGAPKIRAMEIIDEIEPVRRNIYTGSIGYIDLNGNIDLNIAIRTMILKNNKIFFQVGGAVVWDSDRLSEYRETMVKGKALFRAVKQ